MKLLKKIKVGTLKETVGGHYYYAFWVTWCASWAFSHWVDEMYIGMAIVSALLGGFLQMWTSKKFDFSQQVLEGLDREQHLWKLHLSMMEENRNLMVEVAELELKLLHKEVENV